MLIYTNGSPGDISFDCNGVTVAVDVYTLDAAAPSNMYTDVDKLLDAERRVKEARYEALCTDREVNERKKKFSYSLLAWP